MEDFSGRAAAIGRRGFLHGLALVGASLISVRRLGATTPPTGRGSPRPPGAGDGQPATLPRGVRIVGETYLAEHPGEASRDRLRALVPGDREELGRRVRKDFERDEVVSVRGWLLSRTECRACALAVLTAAARTGAGA